MCFFSVVVVEFETGAYTVAEDAGSFTVCVTKDKTTTSPIIILLTPEETSPPSATGDHSQPQQLLVRLEAVVLSYSGPYITSYL